MISMVVVLPAPFGPSSPKHTPSGTLKEMLSSAVTPGYCLTRSRTSRIGEVMADLLAARSGIVADRRAVRLPEAARPHTGKMNAFRRRRDAPGGLWRDG